ncbi:winged helix-turn-helix domain-containing protein (plasmid) [Sinorhizobium numidicum]|uniref:Winged helix-turn-helix domain-containing protein n=1 Tax=Sinorhizobium numidicum TaxID=680248 RepID=A0ABY8D361_9HYPH|nr:winged helix-turn-helix domain-containing protein [Sinorhizobium numidicum]WEX79310.1 winged helix-turn-helix domain-containing protein [Sinorhizobium numidicum]WEX85319.1 winged helix-turn-helix domain-containing protein [Sinorhizobium numidicum]
MKNILVISQDASLRELVVDSLSKHEFSARAVENGQQAAVKLASEAIDLAIIDLSFGPEDGLRLVRDFGAKIDLPIIIINSGDDLDVAGNVTGLETGARNYITKPFGLPELLARVRAALREWPGRDCNKIFHFDDWRVSAKRRRLRRGTDREVKLTAGEFNLLMAFLKNPGRVLSREQLLVATRVYHQEVYDRSIDVQILRLRRKLGQRTGSSPQYIRTERGTGYVFDSVVNVEELRTRTH